MSVCLLRWNLPPAWMRGWSADVWAPWLAHRAPRVAAAAMAKSPEVKLAVFGRAGVGKSGKPHVSAFIITPKEWQLRFGSESAHFPNAWKDSSVICRCCYSAFIPDCHQFGVYREFLSYSRQTETPGEEVVASGLDKSEESLSLSLGIPSWAKAAGRIRLTVRALLLSVCFPSATKINWQVKHSKKKKWLVWDLLHVKGGD